MVNAVVLYSKHYSSHQVCVVRTDADLIFKNGVLNEKDDYPITPDCLSRRAGAGKIKVN